VRDGGLEGVEGADGVDVDDGLEGVGAQARDGGDEVACGAGAGVGGLGWLRMDEKGGCGLSYMT